MPGVSPPPLAGVIGWPVGHSRSPRLHGHWLRRHGIAGHYVPMAVAPADLAAAFAALPKLGFRGVNVTIPHKEQALALADAASDAARRIGAANTITFLPDRTVHADNTDHYGFLANLRQAIPMWSPSAGPALVLGAGGAARAVVSALLAEGAPEVRLANRTRGRAETLAAQLGPGIAVIDWREAAAAAAGAATIVNATSLGMTGGPALELPLDAAPPHAVVADLVYDPFETPLLAAARARGLTGVDGLGMLLHQAVPGFQRWFGVRPEVDAELRAAVLAR
jgi:shikimate dehydrogenase